MTAMQGSRLSASLLRRLFLYFVVWKALILLIACLSPGIGYDTSSNLLTHAKSALNGAEDVPVRFDSVALKFVRWDAIYFTQIARRGHIHEQEWAFGKGFSTTLQTIAQVLGLEATTNHYALIGIVLSHIGHWFCVVLLFLVVGELEQSASPTDSPAPFVAAVLHIISPAGIFLTAPYMESLFSFLNMLGFYLYVRSTRVLYQDTTGGALLMKLCSGVVFGLGATVRGNGIFSGIPFLIDAIESVLSLINPRVDSSANPLVLLQLQFTVLAGSCVGLGMAYPQFIAYKEYCIDGSGERPWCNAWLPSIFTFVQSHYWQVGFLRYWTLSNVPLFLLALPSLYILIKSGMQGIRPMLKPKSTLLQKLEARIAMPQLALALLALTNYHVQIITRLSPAYPFWYIWFARHLQVWEMSGWMIRIFTMYALIQTGLFASFLPPA